MADILEAGEDALRARDGFHRKSSISRHVSIKEMRLFTIEARNKAQLISCPPIMITEPAPGDSLPSCTGDSLPSCTRSTNPALLLPPKKRHHGPARMVNVSFHQKRRYSAFERNVKGEKKRSDKENYVFCDPPSPEGGLEFKSCIPHETGFKTASNGEVPGPDRYHQDWLVVSVSEDVQKVVIPESDVQDDLFSENSLDKGIYNTNVRKKASIWRGLCGNVPKSDV